MTAESLMAVLSGGAFCVAAIYFGTKNNNKNISHDNEKEIWRAVNENKKHLEIKINETKIILESKIDSTTKDVRENYWDSSRTQQFYELSSQAWSLRLDHIESQMDNLQSGVTDLNKKFDIIVDKLPTKP